jgi:hypothetical protein
VTNPTPGVVSVTTPPPAPAAGGGAHAAPDSVPAPVNATSPLAALRDRRQKLLSDLYTDLRVPRWGDDGGPQIFVRYGPAQPSEFRDRIEKRQKQQKKPKDWMVQENCQILVTSCIGVYAVEGDAPAEGEPDTRAKLSLRDGDPHGDWTKFDPDLAYSLGLDENCGAVAVVRALYFTEPDIDAAVQQLLRWSGVALPSDNQAFFGS